ncbi:Potassium channel subfamily T member 1 [Stylophora pistillata]|uniref:Potassium channel subfamily T member 1 n=1 Tax=Stylophora pistillata TaxID=50429 RepID=A0A2B4SMI8_STYPI|nr:Potassium channel subfamily T member 1 [Stylophora pistillata]
MADSGARINILDEKEYRRLPNRLNLEPSNVKIYGYQSKAPFRVLGKFTTALESETKKLSDRLYVIIGSGGSLLSWRASQGLNLLQTVQQIRGQLSKARTNAPENLIEEYDDLFHGLGKLKNYQIKLHIDENVPPVGQPHRRVSFHVGKQLEEQLQHHEELGVIEHIEGPTPWVSPIVVAPKPKSPGKVCVCVDMRQANKVIRREHHVTPTIKEMIGDLNGVKVFTNLDLNQGYNQLELALESRYITTFGIDCAKNISDDILVFGKSHEEHDQNLRAVFQHLREKGLTLNKSKGEYSKDKLEFFGYVFSKDSIASDPKKVEEVVNLSTPSTASEVRSLLGMTNYCSRFIPDYATKTEPLRKLTHKDQPWCWTTEHDWAVNQLREALSSTPVTAYFDPEKETEISLDASPVGLAAILSQVDQKTEERHVVTYASRSLTATEQRYSQTEREALAVVWACEDLHLYVYGKPITVYTDHKPLVTIYDNPSSKPSARIERWALRLQPYQITVKYSRGETNPADYLSRHPAKNAAQTTHQQKIAEEYINYLATTSTPKALKTQDIEAATQADATLQGIAEAIMKGNWHLVVKRPGVNLTEFRLLERVKDELAVSASGNLILHGTRIVIPKSLQEHVVNLAHEGHQGLVKTKSLLHEKVWFWNIDKLVESKLDKLFSEFGVPDVVKSNNGPPFNCKEFASFADDLGFKHQKVTPKWARTNGEVKRFVCTVKKVIKTAKLECKNPKQELNRLLRNYRATPHSTTRVAPATALFGRPMKMKLPELTTPRSAKAKIKKHADNKRYVKPSTIKEGDTVFVKRDDSKKKSDTPYDPRPHIIVGKKGSMVTAQDDDGVQVTRNSSFFKNVPVAAEENATTETGKDLVDVTPDVTPEAADAPMQADVPPSRCYPLRVRTRPVKLDDYWCMFRQNQQITCSSGCPDNRTANPEWACPVYPGEKYWWSLLWVDRPPLIWILQTIIAVYSMLEAILLSYLTFKGGSVIGQIVNSHLIAEVLLGMPFLISLEQLAFLLVSRQKEGGTFNRMLAGSEKHVVLCATILRPTMLIDFLNEFYADASLQDSHVVLLCPSELDSTLRILLQVPLWSQRVTYLKGSALIDEDLIRARVEDAGGCFILTDRYAVDREAADKHTILRTWAIQDFAPHTPLYVQILKPENKFHVSFAEHVVCEDEVKHALLASNCVCPGISTFFTLLLHTLHEQSGSEDWHEIYGKCAGNEIYDIRLEDSKIFKPYAQKSFTHAAFHAHKKYGVTLFAVHSSGKGSRILLNPGPTHTMSKEDRCFYIAISSEEDTAFKAYKEPKNSVGLFKGSFRHKNYSFITASSVALELNTDSFEAVGLKYLDEAPVNGVGHTSSGDQVTSSASVKLEEGTSPTKPSRGIKEVVFDIADSRRSSNSEYVFNETDSEDEGREEQEFSLLDDTSRIPSYVAGVPPCSLYIGRTPIRCHLLKTPKKACCLGLRNEACLDRDLNDSARLHQRQKGAIIVASPVAEAGLYNFILPLRAYQRPKCTLKPIVLLLKEEPSEDFLMAVCHFPMLYYILGNINSLDDLLKAGCLHADSIVVVGHRSDGQMYDEEHMADASTIVEVQSIYSLTEVKKNLRVLENFLCITEISKKVGKSTTSGETDSFFGRCFPRATLIVELTHASNMRFMKFNADVTLPYGLQSESQGSFKRQSFRESVKAFVKDYMIYLVRLLLGCEQSPGSGYLSSLKITEDNIWIETYGRLFQRLCSTTFAIPIGLYRSHIQELKITEDNIWIETYGRLFQRLCSTTFAIPIGLYRSHIQEEESIDAFPRMRKKETRDISDIIENRMKVLNITGTPDMTQRSGNSYVVVNPNPEFRLQIGDIIYLIRPCNTSMSDAEEEPTDPDRADDIPSTSL